MSHDDAGLRRWFGRDADDEPTQQIDQPEPTRRFGDQPTQHLGDHPNHRPTPAWPETRPEQAYGGQAYAGQQEFGGQQAHAGHHAQHGPPTAHGNHAQAYAPLHQTPFPPPQPHFSPQGSHPAPAATRPRARVLPAVAASALTALVIGGAAGYGGARLADGPTATGGGPIVAPTVARAPVPPAQGQADNVKVAERVLPSTVTIAYSSGGRSGTGSGFVIDDRGHIMTNNHVVEGAPGGRVTIQLQDGSERPATVVGRSPGYDLAVIRAEGSGLPAVDLGDSAAVRPGQPVVAVGAPLGLGGSVTAGIVSAVDRPLSVGGQNGTDESVAYINGIQVDAPINPGNSGGPLADGAGRIIGVNSAILTLGGATQDTQQGNIGLGFAIPINQAVDIGNQLITKGKAQVPIIGASVSGDRTGGGVRLSAVTPGGPAAAAGLTANDLVEAVDGRPVRTATELIVRIRTHRPGEVATLKIAGRGDVRVTLGSRDG
ncbi:S1C family serine protease [Mariniluteicoccus flavus]